MAGRAKSFMAGVDDVQRPRHAWPPAADNAGQQNAGGRRDPAAWFDGQGQVQAGERMFYRGRPGFRQRGGSLR